MANSSKTVKEIRINGKTTSETGINIFWRSCWYFVITKEGISYSSALLYHPEDAIRKVLSKNLKAKPLPKNSLLKNSLWKLNLGI
ncbi:M55 family metallopeptidase [Candidatus Caldipriscus sp.]|nr:M55 family metallopeptidase [Candidatus Caldipriscus sp.]